MRYIGIFGKFRARGDNLNYYVRLSSLDLFKEICIRVTALSVIVLHPVFSSGHFSRTMELIVGNNYGPNCKVFRFQ